MGGCATKPKVSKDDPDVKAKAPEPELLKEDAVDETKVPQETAEPVPQHDNTVVVDDDEDQPNKRRSLSLLFDKENDGTKVPEENEKTAFVETVKQESSKAEEKKLLNNEAAKQESPLIELEEKSPLQKETNKPAEEPTKPEKLTEENQRSEPFKQEFVEAKETFSGETQNKEPLKQEFVEAKETFSVETQNKEPIKQEPLPAGISTIEQPEAVKPSGGLEKNGSNAEKSETLIEENTNTKVVPQTEEKIVEALLTDAGPVQRKIITEEATSNREEKNHNEVNHASKATDASSVKT